MNTNNETNQETLDLKYYDELRWLWDIIDKCNEDYLD